MSPAPPSGPPSGPPPQRDDYYEEEEEGNEFDNDISALKDNLANINAVTSNMGNKFGVPGITEDEEEDEDGMASASHGVDTNAELQIDPSLLRKTSGYLWKRASDSKKWKKRFFVLKHQLRSRNDPYELYYFSKPTDTTPKAIIVLDGAEVVAESRNAKEKGVKFEFQLYVAGGSMVELYADNQHERSEWLDTLGAIISAHRRRMHVGGGVGLGGGGASGGLYNIQVTEDQAQSCEAFGPGLFGAEAGTPTTFTIQATDASGAPMTEGGIPFTATLENDDFLYNIQVLDNDDGTYSSSYAISAPGDYNLALKLNDEYHIFGSPFAVRVAPGPANHLYSVAKGDGLGQAKSMETSYFSIEARDNLGNQRASGGDAFEVSVAGPAVLKGLQDNNDGTYSCAFEVTATADTISQVPKAVTLNVELNGRHVKGSPFQPILEKPDNTWEVVPAGYVEKHTVSAVPAAVDEPPQPPYSPTEARQQFQGSLTSPLASPSNYERTAFNTAPNLKPAFGRDDSGNASFNRSAPIQSTNPNTPMSPSEAPSGALSAGISKLAIAREKARARKHGAGKSDMDSLANTPALPQESEAQSVPTGMGVPSDLSADEQGIWNSALSLMRDPQVLPMFEGVSSHLMLVFDNYCTGSGSKAANGVVVKTLALGASGGQHKGALQMAMDYDVVPSFLTKKEVRSCYNVVSRMNQGGDGAVSVGLGFGGFIQFLGLLAIRGLSKQTFQNLYPTNVKKVGVLLDMWGFGDPIKLQMLAKGKK